MLFEWDPAKRLSNVAKHKIDFVRARRIFDGRRRLDFASPRDGEDRILSIAVLDDRFVAVIWMWRSADVVRIISARSARRAEESQYRQIYG